MTFTELVENIVRHRVRQCLLQLVALDSRQSRADTNDPAAIAHKL